MRRKYWPDFKSKRAVKVLLIMRPFHFYAFCTFVSKFVVALFFYQGAVFFQSNVGQTSQGLMQILHPVHFVLQMQ